MPAIASSVFIILFLSTKVAMLKKLSKIVFSSLFAASCVTASAVNVQFVTETNYGVSQIYADGVALLTGCGFGFIGSATLSDTPANITTCNHNNGGIMFPFTQAQTPNLPFRLQFAQDGLDPTKLNFGGEFGPSAYNFATLSMPMDANKNVFQYFRFAGSPLYKYSDNPFAYTIPATGQPVYIFNAGGNQTWGEIISPDYTIRVTLTGTTRPMNLYFVNHPDTRNVEFSWGAVNQGDRANVTGYIQVSKTDPSLLPGLTFQTEESAYHQIGRADGDGWSVNVVNDAPGQYLNYGPYTTGLGGGNHSAVFTLQADNVSADNNAIVVLEVNDASTGSVLASRQIRRSEFRGPFTYTDFSVPFTATAGHSLEFRTRWLGGSYIKQDKVIAR